MVARPCLFPGHDQLTHCLIMVPQTGRPPVSGPPTPTRISSFSLSRNVSQCNKTSHVSSLPEI